MSLQRTGVYTSVKTRGLQLENKDGTLPPLGGLLTVDALGKAIWTRSPDLDNLSARSLSLTGGDTGVGLNIGGLFLTRNNDNIQVSVDGRSTFLLSRQMEQTPDSIYHYIHDNPDVITSIQRNVGPVEIILTYSLPESVAFAAFPINLPAAHYLKIQSGSVYRSLDLSDGVNSVFGGIRLRNDIGVDGIQGRMATFYLGNTDLVGVGKEFDLDIWFEGVGGATLLKHKAQARALVFALFGPPSTPRDLSGNVSIIKQIQLSWIEPEKSDITNNKLTGEVGAPLITSYTISPSVVSSRRYFGATYTAGEITLPGRTYSLTGLYPATTYKIAVRATNNGGITGGDVSGQFTTAAPDLLPVYINNSGITFLTSDFTGGGSYYSVGGGATPVTVPIFRVKGSANGWSTQLTTPIGVHVADNIGVSGDAIMTFTVSNGNTADDCSVVYNGFPAASYASADTSQWKVTPGATADVALTGLNSGYYLQTTPTITYKTAVGVGTDQTITLRQTHGTTGVVHTRSIVCQWDALEAGVSPAVSGINVTVDATKLKEISGTKYFGGPFGFTVDAALSGMGSHHYRTNPVVVSTTPGGAVTTLTTLSSLTGISGVSLTGTSGVYYAPGSYSISVTATNLNNLSNTGTSSVPFPAIDPAAVTLWNATALASPGALGTSLTYGQRVSSTTLEPFSDSGDLTVLTNEALLAKGYFCCPGFPGAYINYPQGRDYSGITTGTGGIGGRSYGYRYATFRWTGWPNLSTRLYSYMKIEVETAGGTTLAINNTQGTNTSGQNLSNKLFCGADIVDIYYNIAYTGGAIAQSGWIDANSVPIGSGFSNIKNGTPSDGSVGGQEAGEKNKVSIAPSGVGNVYTYYVALPSVVATAESYVYVSVGCKNNLGFKVRAAYVTF